MKSWEPKNQRVYTQPFFVAGAWTLELTGLGETYDGIVVGVAAANTAYDVYDTIANPE